MTPLASIVVLATGYLAISYVEGKADFVTAILTISIGCAALVRSMVVRQEKRIELLEKQNGQQQEQIDKLHEQDAICRANLARLEERIRSYEKKDNQG